MNKERVQNKKRRKGRLILENLNNNIDEEILWESRGFFLTFPIPFTVYTLTRERILLKRGIIKTNYDETRLYRVNDIKLSQNLIQKFCDTYTITLYTRDKAEASLLIKNVKQGHKVKELISNLVEESRRRNRVINAEF